MSSTTTTDDVRTRVGGGTTEVAPSTARPRMAHRGTSLRGWVLAAYALLGVVLVGYVAAVIGRGPEVYWTWLDGWVVVGFEVAASALCFTRAARGGPTRTIALVLGLALLSWTLGDAVLTAQSIGGATPPSPSLADVFYLGFYPLAYVAAVLLLRTQLGRLSRPNWLDGLVAGFGAAAICATFAFHDILKLAGGGALATAVNVSYPIGDVLLLFLVVGGTALLGRARREMWYLLAAGIALNVVGDTFNLLQRSVGSSPVGIAFNAIAWPTSILAMSLAMWGRPAERNPLAEPHTAGFGVPSLGAVAGLVLLSIGTQRHLGQVAIGLALATLVTAGVRLGLSARDLRLITEQRHRQAMTDELTGLGNRRRLAQILEAFFTGPDGDQSIGSRMAFLFVDLNHFKEINDSFGHPAGDELLRQVGPRLAGAVRGTDAVMRLGGDEFGIVLLDADASEATTVAGRIADGLLEPFFLDGVAAHVGVSIGIALCPSDAADAAGLLWCADVAMYRAKLGHVPFACYDHDLDGDAQQLALVDELRVAVEERRLVVHYQPQLDLRSGSVVAVEALVRWPHPDHGIIPPLKFLPLAEDAGLMGPLTEFVLDASLAQCAAWRSAGRLLAVSVNVSPSNLADPGFPELVTEMLGRYGLPGEALVLELTETSVVRDPIASQAAIATLRDAGVEVSIDDFGAGVTSLAYLKSLSVRELKLDRTLILGLGAADDARTLGLVRATIDLGHAMGLRVVAEGIEDDETLELLRRLGCDLAQGYLISRPMPASELAIRPTLAASVPPPATS